jgi:hypothetical protein
MIISKNTIFAFLLCSLMAAPLAYGMDDNSRFTHNTYNGVVITPESLVSLAPQMPKDFEQSTDQWMDQHHEFVSELVTTPHPLTHEVRKKKTETNAALIKEYESKNIVRNLSGFNYVLKFPAYNFTVPINRWGSRVAYWVYATDQGSVLDPHFKPDFDCSRFEYIPSYQHCSRVAHYLRLIEIMKRKNFQYLKTTPTYLKHIPDKPDTLSDEHYVVVQEWVENLKELKQLPANEQLAIRKNISPPALQEMYEAIVYAALWDMRGNLALNADDGTYYMLDLEEPFNHKPQMFFFQGQEGRKKYVLDVIDGLERMACKLQEPEQMNRWRRFVEDDLQLQVLFKEYAIAPNFDPEYLATRD